MSSLFFLPYFNASSDLWTRILQPNVGARERLQLPRPPRVRMCFILLFYMYMFKSGD